MTKNDSETFLSRFLNQLSDHNSPRGPVYLGMILVLFFTVAASLAPTLSTKLGSLDQKKESQITRADVDNFLSMINNYRAQNGAPPLVEDQELMRAACWKANDMATNNYYSHTDSYGRTLEFLNDLSRPPYVQVGDLYLAENLDATSTNASTAFDRWKNSASHNTTMLSTNFNRIGIGVAYNPASEWGYYWATEFAGKDYYGNFKDPKPLTSQDCNLPNRDPQGVLEGPSGTINCETTNITGWASDPDTPTQSVEVHMYFDGPAGQGTGFPGIYANLSDHRYSWPVPSQFRSGTHSVYAYAINTQAGNNSLLGGSPKTYTCQPPPPAPLAQLTVTPNPCLVPSPQTSCQTTVNWNTTGYQNVVVCVNNSSSPIGQGVSGSVQKSLEAGKTHTLRLRSSTCSGTILATTMAAVYKIDQSAGDVDCTGKVDAVDALFILRKVAGMAINSEICSGNGFNESKADIADDNNIDAIDALFVLRIVAGLVTLNPPAFSSNYADMDNDLMTDAEEDSYSCLRKTKYDSTTNSDRDSISVNGRSIGLNNISEIAIRSNPCLIDTDGDGFGDVAEVYIGTKPDVRCGTNAWPADFNNDRKVNIADITSFLAPRRLDTSPGDANYNKRWDVVPGRGIFAKDINIQDLTLVNTTAPPMLGGQRAMNGPACTP